MGAELLQPIASTSAIPASSSAPSPIHAFLSSQSALLLSRIYSSPSVSLSIFRLLTPVARYIVGLLLWTSGQVPLRDLQALLQKQDLDGAVIQLSAIHAVQGMKRPDSLGKVERVVCLSPAFKSGLRAAFTGLKGGFGTAVKSARVSSVLDEGGDLDELMRQLPEEGRVTVGQLDEYARAKWETLLQFMVGASTKPELAVLNLLANSGLLHRESIQHGIAKVTSVGFGFLLKDVKDQLWEILLHYLQGLEARSMDLGSALITIFMLGNLQLGQQYTLDGLDETSVVVLHDLACLGLVHFNSNKTIFSPTRLATTLTLSSAAPLSSSSDQASTASKGFILLESNYRLYAYTSSPLQIALLNLFVKMDCRYPNLVTGTVTRESMKAALLEGITAEQIIGYLNMNAHPQMMLTMPILPITVSDQLRLWALESDRIKSESGVVYSEFTSSADYELVLEHARPLGVLMYENKASRKFVVTMDGHEMVQQFVRRKLQEARALSAANQ